MLESLTIKNVALIRDGMIVFNSGFNCLSGETGSGKSLIIDSLSLLLGEKADKTIISHGENQAFVEAVFTTNNVNVLNSLDEFGLDRENTIIISRKITSDGKNECRVNGKMFTLSMLKKITQPLMDLHGQFQHQSLLKVSNHLPYLDGLADEKTTTLKSKFAELFAAYTGINKELIELTEDDRERQKLIDLYRYQIDEIKEANFKVGEDEELRAFHTLVCNSERISEALNTSINLLEGDSYIGGAVDQSSKIVSTLSNASKYTDKVSEILDRATSVQIELKDILDTLYSIKDDLLFDEREAAIKEARLDLFNAFTKKYGKTVEDINKYLSKITIEYDKLANSEEYIIKLKKEKEKLQSEILHVGGELSICRKTIATRLEEQIGNELHQLGMKNAVFKVQFINKDLDNFDAFGLDGIEFMFSANAGVPVRPLTKVVSGGEMSRLMLAIKNITAGKDSIETMIFDEIDSGVSGHIAGVLAEKMMSISKGRQIICVTHLPQICAMADHNFYISKSSDGKSTETNIEILNGKRKVEEVARLTGGALTEVALSHATELIAEANKQKAE